MSPPTPADQLRNLARLARTALPKNTDPSPIVFVRLVATAQQRGATWAMIAEAVGAPDGKAAKRWAHQQAKLAQRRLLARDNLVTAHQDSLGAA